MTRYYPYGELFAHVIGYVGRINDKELKQIDKDAYAGSNLIGKIGVEKSYEHLLHGVLKVMSLLKQMLMVMHYDTLVAKILFVVMTSIFRLIMAYRSLPVNNWQDVVGQSWL